MRKLISVLTLIVVVSWCVPTSSAQERRHRRRGGAIVGGTGGYLYRHGHKRQGASGAGHTMSPHRPNAAIGAGGAGTYARHRRRGRGRR